MARKSSTKKVSVEEQVQEPVASAAPEIKEEEKKVEVKAEKPEKKPEIPDIVDAVLKINYNYKKLWIDSKGIRKFPEGTPERLLEGCTLYENPYFNNQ